MKRTKNSIIIESIFFLIWTIYLSAMLKRPDFMSQKTTWPVAIPYSFLALTAIPMGMALILQNTFTLFKSDSIKAALIKLTVSIALLISIIILAVWEIANGEYVLNGLNSIAQHIVVIMNGVTTGYGIKCVYTAACDYTKFRAL